MSGGVGEEVGPHVGGGLAGEFGEVVGEFLFGVAPGEVGVGLLEADLGEGAHHRGAGEGLGEEDDVGVGAADVGDHAFPEEHRFGVGVVDAEDPHAVGHPVPQDPQGLGDQAVHVGVEGDGVDVLVFLRRVLGVGDGAVGAVVEPLGVFVDPGVVGGALEARSRAISRPWCAARRTNQVKSSSVPSAGWIVSWPPSGEPMAQGTPTSSGPASRVLLRPLRKVVPMGWTGGR